MKGYDDWLQSSDPGQQPDEPDDWYGCPARFCSFEGTEYDMDAHMTRGDHNTNYQTGGTP